MPDSLREAAYALGTKWKMISRLRCLISGMTRYPAGYCAYCRETAPLLLTAPSNYPGAPTSTIVNLPVTILPAMSLLAEWQIISLGGRADYYPVRTRREYSGALFSRRKHGYKDIVGPISVASGIILRRGGCGAYEWRVCSSMAETARVRFRPGDLNFNTANSMP